MSSKPTVEQITQQIKDAKTEALRGKNSVLAFEKSSKRASESIEKTTSGAKLKASTQLKTLNTEITTEHRAYRDAAKGTLKEVDQVATEVKKKATAFGKIYASATSIKTGVKARHDQINSLHKGAVDTAGAIDKGHTKVEKTVGDVSELLQTARSNSRSISDVKKNAEKVNKAINETYQLTLDATMSGSLIERRDALKTTTKWWSIAFLSSIGAIVLGILVVAVSIALADKTADYVRLIIERFLFITPLIVIALVLSRFYNHERKLYEEYAFKAASAQTIRGYTVLLNEEFGDNSELSKEILEFTIAVMTGIFDREPLVQSPTLMHFIVGGNLAKFEAKIEDKLETLVKTASTPTKP